MNEKYPLPDGWRWVKLGEVCEINPSRPKNFNRSPDVLTTFIPMSIVNEKSGLVNKPEVVPYRKVAKGYTYFEENDVLFSKITPCMQNGKHIIARNLIDGIGFGTTEFHVLRPNSDVLPDWIHFFIRQPYFLQEATAYFTGAVGQQRVPDSFLSNYLPPVEDQQRIATKLQELMQEVERARTACEKQLEAAKTLPTVYLREVFESEEAQRWETKRLGEVCEIIKGKKPDLYDKLVVGETLPYLTAEVIRLGIEPKWCLGSDTKSVQVSENEVIIIADGSNSGEVFTGYKGALASTMGKLKIGEKETSKDYLFFFIKLNFERMNTAKRGAAIPHLEKEIFYNLLIPLPPPPNQHKIASELKGKMVEAEKFRTSIEKQLETINALPQVILKKAFRGEL
jgi:type I restriction enzyme S subunit